VTSEFPFSDLHSFKDFIVFVRMCAPDEFPAREGVPPSEQWSLELAFEGLNAGLDMAREQKASPRVIADCQALFDLALSHYRAGDRREGFQTLDKAHRAFGKVRARER
jgi:hypothetical protein